MSSFFGLVCVYYVVLFVLCCSVGVIEDVMMYLLG